MRCAVEKTACCRSFLLYSTFITRPYEYRVQRPRNPSCLEGAGSAGWMEDASPCPYPPQPFEFDSSSLPGEATHAARHGGLHKQYMSRTAVVPAVVPDGAAAAAMAAVGQPLLQPPAVHQSHRLMRRIEAAVAVSALAVSSILWRLTAAGLTPAEHANQAKFVALELAFLALLASLPHARWLKHRWAGPSPEAVGAACICSSLARPTAWRQLTSLRPLSLLPWLVPLSLLLLQIVGFLPPACNCWPRRAAFHTNQPSCCPPCPATGPGSLAFYASPPSPCRHSSPPPGDLPPCCTALPRPAGMAWLSTAYG